MFKKTLVFIMCLSLVLCSGINAFTQSSYTDAINEGLTLNDISSVMNFYYMKPQPAKLLSITKILISQQVFLIDPKNAEPFAHFVATVAHNDTLFLNSLENLKDMNFGLAKNYLQHAIDETNTFQSPVPITINDIRNLWVEFIATGDKKPVLKIINILELPATDANAPLIGLAHKSLVVYSYIHPGIFQILQESVAASSGLKKERLEKIIKLSQKKPKRKLSKYGFVDDKYFKEKKERIDKLITSNPEDAKNYLSRGIANANNSNFDEALGDFQKALTLDPNLPTANNYVCFIYINKDEYIKAEEYCRKAIEQSPNFSKPYFNLARIYQHWKDYPKAIDSVTKAIACEQNFFEAYALRASFYEETGEYEKAITDLVKAKKMNFKRQKSIDSEIERIREKIKKQSPVQNTSKNSRAVLMESALAKEGLTMEDFLTVVTYYYQNPQQDKLISIVKVMLSKDELINDPNHFGTFIHFVAAVAHNNQSFLGNLKNISQGYAGIQKDAVDKMISGAENFNSPLPNSPENLDYLWGEFLATGREEPVKKIISVLSDLKPVSLDSRLTQGAAEWSLGSNARQHKKVYEIVQKESISATGTLKDKLDNILKAASQSKG